MILWDMLLVILYLKVGVIDTDLICVSKINKGMFFPIIRSVLMENWITEIMNSYGYMGIFFS